jgi:hypothetical protein
MTRREGGRPWTVVRLSGALVLLITQFACSSRAPVVVAATSTSPATATRFEITEVQDSTFTIAVRGVPWVGAGMTGIVVDPAKRDVLVARYRIVRRGAADATALVTGQTTKVTIDQAALLQAPAVRTSSKKAFWSGWGVGFLLGAVAGGIAGLASR